MTVKLAVVVQHSPLRAELLPRLTDRLTDPLIITDPGGEISSAWRTYRLCLRADVGDASHLVVIQDDCVVCDWFEEAATAAIEACPESVVIFCLCAQPARTAMEATQALKRREHWARLQDQDWLPTICTAWPVAVARDAADWVDARPREPRGDDAVLGDFLRSRRHDLEAWCTLPSLVEHPDDQVSLIGRRAMAGKNPGRVALHFIGDGDPRKIDWTT